MTGEVGDHLGEDLLVKMSAAPQSGCGLGTCGEKLLRWRREVSMVATTQAATKKDSRASRAILRGAPVRRCQQRPASGGGLGDGRGEAPAVAPSQRVNDAAAEQRQEAHGLAGDWNAGDALLSDTNGQRRLRERWRSISTHGENELRAWPSQLKTRRKEGAHERTETLERSLARPCLGVVSGEYMRKRRSDERGEGAAGDGVSTSRERNSARSSRRGWREARRRPVRVWSAACTCAGSQTRTERSGCRNPKRDVSTRCERNSAQRTQRGRRREEVGAGGTIPNVGRRR